MKKISLLISILYLQLLCFSSFAQTPVAANGQLSVVGTKLTNQYGNPIQLRGMSTHGLQWYGWGNCLTEASLDAMAYNWGSDILRISMYIQEGGYETNPTGFTNQVKTLVNEAKERGMYALIDFHQLSPGDPNYNTTIAKTFFAEMANTFKDYNNVIYDICNEPNGVGWSAIRNYATQVIPVIRAIDNNAVVLVGTHGWATFGVSGNGNLQDVINNPLPYTNVMYTFHFYAASHGSQYLQRLDEASNVLPVFVTEFGTQTASGDGGNNFTMSQQYINLMQQKKISWCNWNYSDDNRTGAVWNSGTCSSGNFTVGNLKEAGVWVRDKMLNPADNFPGGGNIAPTVSITSPANGNTFTAGTNITVSANATDSDGSISSVVFYNGTTSLGTDNTSPYSVTINGAAAGTYSLKAVATDNSGAQTTSSTITITVNQVVTQSPYNGIIAQIPGTVEAEKYDLGGEGVAYSDNSAGNSGTSFRTDNVDIEATSGGYNVGWIATGEWLEYTVNIVTAGNYNISVPVAATTNLGKFRIEMNGQNVSGTLSVPNTGGWQTWQTITKQNVALTAGQKIMRVYIEAGDFNLDKITFAQIVSNNAPAVSITSPTTGSSFTAGTTITISANATDSDGTIASVVFFNGTTNLGTDNTAPYSATINGAVAGSYTLTAVATDNGGAQTTSSAISITVNPVVSTQSPYNGVIAQIPGTVEAEKYDLGGEGIAYHDNTTGNTGTYFRAENVDIEPTTGGYNIGWIVTGEWLEYTVNITSTDNYNISIPVAATSNIGKFRIEMDGQNISGTLSVPNTGGWQTWQTATKQNVALTTGQKIMRVYIEAGDFNLDKITFTKVIVSTNTPPTVSISSPSNGNTFTAGSTISISANAADSDGSIASVVFYNGTTNIGTDNTAPYSISINGAAAGAYALRAIATDNSGAQTTSAIVNVTVESVVTGCNGIPSYSTSSVYGAANQVTNVGGIYECKAWPYSGWCSASPAAYAPGVGTHWTDAWIFVSSCSSSPSARTATLQEAVVYPNPASTQIEILGLSNGKVEIVNSFGNVELTVNITNSSVIDISSLTQGVYTLKVYSNGTISITKLVVNK